MRTTAINPRRQQIRTRAIQRRHIDELPPDMREALSERFWEACKRYTDPYLAAEKIGCEIRFDKDGAPVVYF